MFVLAAVPTFVIPLVAVVVVVVLLVVAAYAMYRVPGPNQALLITGIGSKQDNTRAAQESTDPNAPAVVSTMDFKVVTGKGAFVLPVVQRASMLGLQMRRVDLGEDGRGLSCVSKQSIPVLVEAVVIFKVGDDRASIVNAGRRFMDARDDEIAAAIKELAHGHLRTIVGGLTVEELITNRTRLTDEARNATALDMQKLGLQIDSLQVKGIQDVVAAQGELGYIEALGKPQAAAVAAQARIAAAQRDQEAAEKEAETAAIIAEAKRDADVRRAAAQAETDKAQAEAAQAGPRAAAEARQAVVEADTRAAELEAALEEQRLQTSVRKPADAKAYEQVTLANAERESSIAAAEAKAKATELAASASARATKLSADADSEARRKLGEASAAATKAGLLADAEGSRQKGLAEAEGIAARQKALAESPEGVIAQTVAEQLPEIVAAAAKPFESIEHMTVLNGAEGLQQAVLSAVATAQSVLPLAEGLTSGITGHDRRDGAGAANGSRPDGAAPKPPA